MVCNLAKLDKPIFFIWLGVIIFLSVMPHSSGSQVLLSKVSLTKSGFFQHALGYFVLSVFACRAFDHKRIWRYLAGVFVMGILLEIIQIVLPSRSFNYYDVLANGLGVLPCVIAVKTRRARGGLNEKSI